MAAAIIVSFSVVYKYWSSEFGGILAGSHSAQTIAAAKFVGSPTCAGCHQTEAQLWQSSQHKHAMDHASEASVLGDFSGTDFDYFGTRSRFFRNDGKFLVETDGPDGKLATFEVKYTFGVSPLQQYLIEFPDGRLQALSIAWDSRPKEKGGQRWFHLYPDQPIRHDDILHWTKLNQNWNFMCAECHSTGVRKNYDAAADRFATKWAEISVGCETCHGQGSRHVSWASDRQNWWPFGKKEEPEKGLLVRFDERKGVTWSLDPSTGNPHLQKNLPALRKEVETCGLCHARRGVFSEDWVPGKFLSDTHIASPLSQGLYHADGQMRDEVYNYGSFKQSKMFAAGVTCSDCHDPHSAKLRVSGDGVCLQCHSVEKYAAPSHNHHEAANPPLACASCHMPKHTYMVVDERHDHNFQVPRPDLSATLGLPNACNDCHTDKSAQWSASTVDQWFGSKRNGVHDYANAFHTAWSDGAGSAALLAEMAGNRNVPAFARAGALTGLQSRFSPANMDLARAAFAEPDPMLRIGGLDMLENAPVLEIWPLVSPLLSDPSRGVRVRAAQILAAVPTASQPPADRATFEGAAAEFVAAQRLNADRPEARSTLGTFFAQRGQIPEAEAEYKAALRLSPQFVPAAINLSDLYRSLGQDGKGESVLRAAIAASPRNAAAHHAMGLALVRLKRLDEALEELRLAAELEPGQARFTYVYAIGLHSTGRRDDAMRVLKQGLERHPNDREILQALIGLSRDAGEIGAALDYARQLLRISPDDREIIALVEMLQSQIQKPQ